MANLIISDMCNMRCPYCFAEPYMQTAHNFITLEAFEARLDFLDRSGVDETRLIGGEPTLHPHFPALLERAHQRGKHIMVFSHGLIPEKALASLEALSAEECTVLVNMNATAHADGPTDAEMARRERSLERLGSRAILGFNIFVPYFEMDHLIPIILKYHNQHGIRLGLAQPALGGTNVYLHPKQYPIVGRKLAAFARRAAPHGIILDFDCGFVPCMFSASDLDTLRQTGAKVYWRCSPILDISIQGEIFPCFSLAGKIQGTLEPGALASDLRDSLTDKTQLYRAAGIYRECSICRYKLNGECPGGCLASTLRRFQQSETQITVPDEVFDV